MNRKMRVYHRYLGFFLAGIMAVYALSGMVLVFRDTDYFHRVTEETKVLPADTKTENLGEALGMRRLKVEKVEDGIAYFKDGTYNLETHMATYTKKELPYVLERMTHLHKATSDRPLAFLNIFFGLSLLFFVISTFWMFLPKTDIFRKGMYFTLVGVLLTLLLLFL